MTPFMKRFPELGARETRSVTVTRTSDLPDGEYGFIELYCNEPDCDCRRVMVVVLRPETGWKFWAAINYGWESVDFYQKWAELPGLGSARMAGALSRSLDRADPLRTGASESVQVGPAVSWLRAASQKALPALSDRGGGGMCKAERNRAISVGRRSTVSAGLGGAGSFQERTCGSIGLTFLMRRAGRL